MTFPDSEDSAKMPLQQQSVVRWNLAFSASTCAASYSLVSPAFALAVGFGTLLELASFQTMWRSCERIFQSSTSGLSGALPAGVFGLRFLLVALVLFVTLRAGIDPIGLVIGLLSIVPAVLIAAWRARPAIDPNAPALPDDDPTWDAWNPWLAQESAPREDDEPRSILALQDAGAPAPAETANAQKQNDEPEVLS